MNFPPEICPTCKSKKWRCVVENSDDIIFRCDDCKHTQAYDNEETITQNNFQFDEWMSEINAIVKRVAMVSIHDLPDMAYRDLFEAGETPKAAAIAALENADFPVEIMDGLD